jgi:hypothetical protein
MTPIRTRMIAKLYAVSHKIGLDKEVLYDYISAWTGVERDKEGHLISHLSIEQIGLCVDNLSQAQRNMQSNVKQYDSDGTPLGRVKKSQIDKIAKLGYMLHWSSATIREFIAKQTKGAKRDWHDLLLNEATAVITGMEAILRQRRKTKRNWALFE